MGQKIYFDTNQIYYVRRIADEAGGCEFGDYSWAFDVFSQNPEMVADIKALCYIVALQYQWDLEFCSSDASYTELFLTIGNRAAQTREAWEAVEPYLNTKLHKLPRVNTRYLFELESFQDKLGFIPDESDREIIRDFMEQNADILLTSDKHILKHKVELEQLSVKATRPSDWINEFLKDVRGNEDGVKWTERILFTLGS